MIKQGQSLKNDYNEHLASKWSSGYAMQLRSMQRINCMSNTQPMWNTRSICIMDTRSNKGHKCVVLKIIQQHLKVFKKMLQSKDINQSTEY